jgi:hypothetical protein
MLIDRPSTGRALSICDAPAIVPSAPHQRERNRAIACAPRVRAAMGLAMLALGVAPDAAVSISMFSVTSSVAARKCLQRVMRVRGS